MSKNKKQEVASKMKTVKVLKEMHETPASKEWFARHGLPKSKYGPK